METTVLGMNDVLPFGKFKGLDISFILRNCSNGAEYLHWWHYNISNYPLSKSVRDNVSIAIANKYGLFEDDENEDDLEREFSIKHLLTPSDGIGVSKEIYGLESNQFHTVNLVCLSPNHWEENNVGNKHYFFMLKNCKSPNAIRSFHNENLISELLEHRKVMEVLGATNMIEPAEKQLSGLGFNATVRDELVLRISGSHKRVIKVKF